MSDVLTTASSMSDRTARR